MYITITNEFITDRFYIQHNTVTMVTHVYTSAFPYKGWFGITL